MRILLTHHFPLCGADSGLATYDLAQGLVRAGHLVRLLALDFGGPQDGAEIYGSLTVRRVVCRPGKSPDLPFELPGFSAAGNQQTFASLSNLQLAAYREVLRRELDREVDAFNPHLIHAQHIWVQAQLALESGVPYVVRAWGPELEGEQAEPRYQALAEQAADNASRIYVASAALGARVGRAYERATERIVVVPPAVDQRRLAIPAAKRDELLRRWGVQDPSAALVVAVGPLVPDSGFALLLNAAARYSQTHPSATTLIAGAGPQRQELESHTERLGLPNLRLIGQLDRDALTALYQSASATVQPAAEAGSWVGAASALAAGAPVIAIAGSGLEELVTGTTGELLPGADHELLADSIGRALDENWRQAKGPAAQALIAQKFSLDEVVARHVEHYTALLGERFGDFAAE